VWALLALLPALPFMSKFYLLLAFDALLFGAIAMSLDLLMGYTGLVSFGHAAFFGLGAYASAGSCRSGRASSSRSWSSASTRWWSASSPRRDAGSTSRCSP
jgi:ABC-type branched-subunit amino acid transport system permease subunit